MPDLVDTPKASPKLARSGLGRIVTVMLSAVVTAALFFASAGTLDVPRAWLYYGGLLTYLLLATGALLVLAPRAAEVINERGRIKPDVKAWDKVFALVYVVLLLVSPVLAGLDGVRYRWSSVPGSLAAPALAVTLLAYAFVQWAMLVNRHAETGVRIQTDREHQVVTTGPYRFVRHPFYVALVATQLVYPLAIGSLFAYGPALAMAALFCWRTAREDATLQAELPGYGAYAARVRYRLLPGVW
jgi:protein-S-isoprenylcysteine O-methyltransferase Ste14